MTLRIAINGFGRIGRLIFRQAAKDPRFATLAINDISDAATLAHLLEYDSVYGRYDLPVKVDGDTIFVNGRPVKVLCRPTIEGDLWGKMGVDLVIESTGRFTKAEKARVHLDAGAKWVMISAPAKGADATVVFGVNHKALDPMKHKIFSNGSCTTNCLAPVVKVLLENFGITQGLLTTVHSMTNDQRLLDLTHTDLRRARSAVLSMIPTTTGAAKAITEVFPQLKGKLDGLSVRVPTPTVSLCDVTFTSEKPITVETLNNAFKAAADGPLKGIVAFCGLPLVSVDFRSDPHSAIIDGLATMVTGENMGKILAWYDNEYAYAARCVDIARLLPV
jgi:glyceraldehyde 3-phosphate dehydrogenase